MYRPLAVLLMVIHAALVAYAAWCHSPVFNEAGHLGSGLYHLQTGRFEPYRVNPPLVRTVAALPIVLFVPRQDWSQVRDSPDLREEYDVGTRLLDALDGRAMPFLRLARWGCIPFALLGAVVCWRWASRLFGEASGLVALALWCFSPYVLGHASLVTADAQAAAVGVTAFYVFRRWLGEPTWRRALVAGLALGAAQLAKTLLLVFYPLMLLSLIVETVCTARKEGRPSSAVLWAMFGSLVAASVATINAGYLFRGSFRRLDDYRFRSVALSCPVAGREGIGPHNNAFTGTWLGALRVPLPEDYVLGIDRQKQDFEVGTRCYLRGQWQERGGWWYFYLYALAIKVPLGTWALGALAVALVVRCPSYRANVRDEALLLTPAVTVFVLVSLQTNITIHSRYLLPALPFAFIWMSRVGKSLLLRSPAVLGTSLVLLTWSVLSSLYCYPHSLSYFNELVNGPRHGYRHLHDSNVAWNQDLLFLRRWLEAHPKAGPLHLACLGLADPACVGLDFVLPPYGPPTPAYAAGKDGALLGPRPGRYAIDVNFLCGHQRSLPAGDGKLAPSFHLGCDFSYFRRLKPVAMAGYSICIYDITLEEANRLRRELGLPELPARERVASEGAG